MQDVLIYTSLREHLEINKGELIISYEGELFDPPRKEPFFHVTDTRENPRRIAWGDCCPVDRSGVWLMSARIPVSLGWNTMQQMGYCANVSRIFKNGQSIKRNGIEIKITNQPAMIGQAYTDGQNGYVYYPMAVQWRSFC